MYTFPYKMPFTVRQSHYLVKNSGDRSSSTVPLQGKQSHSSDSEQTGSGKPVRPSSSKQSRGMSIRTTESASEDFD